MALIQVRCGSQGCAAFATGWRLSADTWRLIASGQAPASTHRFPPWRDHMPEPLRVVIAEDNYLVREGTRRLLEDSGEVEVVAAAGAPDELLEAVDRLLPHAVLTDIRMPPDHDMEGIQ